MPDLLHALQSGAANLWLFIPTAILLGASHGLEPGHSKTMMAIVCLQLKRATLGFAMVAAFSFGLALTMVTVGMLAALSVQHAQKSFSGFGEALRRAPYVSCALLVILALYMAIHGWRTLSAS